MIYADTSQQGYSNSLPMERLETRGYRLSIVKNHTNKPHKKYYVTNRGRGSTAQYVSPFRK